MALTKDRIGFVHENIVEQSRAPVAAHTKIYAGSFVSYDATGGVVPVADTVAQSGKVIHYAIEGADNTGGIQGAKQVLLMTIGVALVPPGALTQADAGKTVHATADDTLALSSTNNRPVGRLLRIDGALAAVAIR